MSRPRISPFFGVRNEIIEAGSADYGSRASHVLQQASEFAAPGHRIRERSPARRRAAAPTFARDSRERSFASTGALSGRLCPSGVERETWFGSRKAGSSGEDPD